MITRTLLDLCSGRGERARLSILIFHRVLPEIDPLFPDELHADRFDALMAHVRRRFNPLPLGSAIQMLRKGTLPARALSVTFDDGYADNITVAAPILHRNGVPATVFVATSYLDGGCMWNDIVIEACRRTTKDELELSCVGLEKTVRLGSQGDRQALCGELLDHLKYMDFETREEAARKVALVAETAIPQQLMLSSSALRKFDDFGVDIGAHTQRHPILAKLSGPAAWNEISESRNELRKLLGRSIELFAYPNGKPGIDYTIEHVRMVREAGFAAAVSTFHGAASRQSDFYQLPRFTPWRVTPVGFDLLMMQNLRLG